MDEAKVHFSEEEWCDYVRHTAGPELTTRMDQHLSKGCDMCSAANELWRMVSTMAGREAEYEVGESAVRSVRAAFALRNQKPWLSRTVEMAKRVFDSFMEPLPAGVRGGTEPTRHLLHEAGPFLIDVWLERENDDRLWVAGQVLHREGRERFTMGTAIVFVGGGEQVLAQTIANADGEFYTELESASDVKVFLQVPSGAQIGIALPEA